MNKKEKKLLFRIILVVILLLISLVIENSLYSLIIYIACYLLVGGTVIIKALKNIIHGEVIEENFLMTIATIGALIIHEYIEGVLVMLLYQIGELFQSCAVNKSRKSISDLMDIRPDYANLLVEGNPKKVNPNSVNIDDIILVKVGEKIPLDGVIIEGSSYLDTSSLTGESVPIKVGIQDKVLSGCINKNGLLKIKVLKKFKESTVSKILDLVENASSKKSNAENFITKFARYYTPIVVLSALLLTVLLPIFTDITLTTSFQRALSFLVISCPCALVISVPLSFFGGIGGASKEGILIKGSNYLEILANSKTVVFDKTGTLTKGNFEVIKIESLSSSENELLELAAMGECYSNHPIAESIKRKYGKEINQNRISNVLELAGQGISALIDNKQLFIGNKKLMASLDVSIDEMDILGTVSYVVFDNKYLGYLVIADEIKKEAPSALSLLTNNGISKLVMLTGDNKVVAKKVAKNLKIDEVYAELLPEDKLNKLEELLTENKKPTIFVGDGINDAPSLIRADIGIAMGLIGTDAAIEAADIVIMDDDLTKLSKAISIAKKTLVIVKQNIYFSIGVKILFLSLGAFGLVNMMASVFADVGVSIIAILNAMRALYQKV